MAKVALFRMDNKPENVGECAYRNNPAKSVVLSFNQTEWRFNLKLKEFEDGISFVEKSISQMASLTQNLNRIDTQVDNVRGDLIEGLNSMERIARMSLGD